MALAYNSQVVTCVPSSTPDPFVVGANGKWYLTFTATDRVEIWSSDSPINYHDASRHVVWQPPPNTPYSGGIWAPELHNLWDRWYIYVACEDPRHGNRSHRMYVLGGPPASEDPCQGAWEFIGPLQGLPPDQWAIDGTIIWLHDTPYFIYSGWPLGERESDKIQELFIARLDSPAAVDGSHSPVRISRPEHPWEHSDASGINEGPQWLASPDGAWVGIAYSCAGSWTKDYKMNTLRYVGGDPLAPMSWQKGAEPLISTSPDGTGPFGPGHGSFVSVGPGKTAAVFHATDAPTDGWENRKARCQSVVWAPEGPYMGKYVGQLQGTTAGVLPEASADSGYGRLEDQVKKIIGDGMDKIRRLFR